MGAGDGGARWWRSRRWRARGGVREARWSRFRSDSYLAFLEREALRRPIGLDDDAFALFETALRVWRASEGAFDIAWRSQTGSSAAIELDPAARTLRLHAPLALDLGALAKGHALDLVRGELASKGVERALVHGGTSSVVVIGCGWRVGLAGGAARATGWRTRRSASSGQRGRAHVVDPRTRQPVERAWGSPGCSRRADWRPRPGRRRPSCSGMFLPPPRSTDTDSRPKPMSEPDRRDFLRFSAGTAALALATELLPTLEAAPRAAGLEIALVGCGKQGRAILGELSKIEGLKIAGLCDVFESRIAAAKRRAGDVPSCKSHQGYSRSRRTRAPGSSPRRRTCTGRSCSPRSRPGSTSTARRRSPPRSRTPARSRWRSAARRASSSPACSRARTRSTSWRTRSRSRARCATTSARGRSTTRSRAGARARTTPTRRRRTTGCSTRRSRSACSARRARTRSMSRTGSGTRIRPRCARAAASGCTRMAARCPTRSPASSSSPRRGACSTPRRSPTPSRASTRSSRARWRRSSSRRPRAGCSRRPTRRRRAGRSTPTASSSTRSRASR